MSAMTDTAMKRIRKVLAKYPGLMVQVSPDLALVEGYIQGMERGVKLRDVATQDKVALALVKLGVNS